MKAHFNEWLRIATAAIKKSQKGYLVSWHLARELGLKTYQVNYRLDLLVREGKLRKETDCYCSKYYLTEEIKNS